MRTSAIRNFYPRSPCGERQPACQPVMHETRISIHALLAESDTLPKYQHQAYHHFYPRSPCGERHKCSMIHTNVLYFYPRSPCGERPIKGKPASPVISISIHALLAESDHGFLRGLPKEHLFLSTLSLRRATLYSSSSSTPAVHFYPRSPCGERPDELGARLCDYCISIHALLAESDVREGAETRSLLLISIHALLAESDSLLRFRFFGFAISIHALLAESDREKPRQTRTDTNFYPRSPCGERPTKKVSSTRLYVFLSTLSLRRATAAITPGSGTVRISIHALLAESDAGRKACIITSSGFLSTLSLRRATQNAPLTMS